MMYLLDLCYTDFERLGNPGWNWKNFQKYLAKTERCVRPTVKPIAR